jgi:hypothetical protein
MIVQTAVKYHARYIDAGDSMKSMQLGSWMLVRRRGFFRIALGGVLKLSVSQDPDSLIQSGRLTAKQSAVWISQTRIPAEKRAARRRVSGDGGEVVVVVKKEGYGALGVCSMEMDPRVTKTAVL